MGRLTSIALEGFANAIRSGYGLQYGCLVTPAGQICPLQVCHVRCSP